MHFGLALLSLNSSFGASLIPSLCLAQEKAAVNEAWPLTCKSSKSSRDFREPYCLVGNFVAAGAQLIHPWESIGEGGWGSLGTYAQGRFWKMCWMAESLKMCLDLAGKRLNIRRQGGGFYWFPRTEAEAWLCRDPLMLMEQVDFNMGHRGQGGDLTPSFFFPASRSQHPLYCPHPWSWTSRGDGD